MTNLSAIFQPEGVGSYAAGFQWYARQVLGLFFGHATYTAFVGAGIGIARQLPDVRRKSIAIAAGFLVAIAEHFSWDAWLTLFPIENTAIGILVIQFRSLVMKGPFTAAVISPLLRDMHIESRAT